jgi:hypothetical protein
MALKVSREKFQIQNDRYFETEPNPHFPRMFICFKISSETEFMPHHIKQRVAPYIPLINITKLNIEAHATLAHNKHFFIRNGTQNNNDDNICIIFGLALGSGVQKKEKELFSVPN